MKCPECGETIERVMVLSYCTQEAGLKEGTNQIDSEEGYGSPEVGETVSIHCPVCDGIITGAVKED